MTILHIHDKDSEKDMATMKKYLEDNDKSMHFFIFIFMDGCGHCEETKPSWEKLSKMPDHNNKNITIVDLNEKLLDTIDNPELKKNIKGFPTLRYMQNGEIEDYENAKGLTKKDRSYASFLEWIDTKTKDLKKTGQQGGSAVVRRKKRRFTKRNIKYKSGGKWSMKYKRSINCKKPMGFSQRQHCKYGRRK